MPCPWWEYSDVDGSEEVLRRRNADLLRAMPETDHIAVVSDTRPIHAAFFEGLTLPDFGYYAGNYRGDNFECLINCVVSAGGDARVGHRPAQVADSMNRFRRLAREIDTRLDEIWAVEADSDPLKFAKTVDYAAGLFVYFLEIHPYINGNGHMARYVLLCILARRNLYPANFTVDPRPRPANLPYGEAISDYRDGKKRALLEFIIGLF